MIWERWGDLAHPIHELMSKGSAKRSSAVARRELGSNPGNAATESVYQVSEKRPAAFSAFSYPKLD